MGKALANARLTIKQAAARSAAELAELHARAKAMLSSELSVHRFALCLCTISKSSQLWRVPHATIEGASRCSTYAALPELLGQSLSGSAPHIYYRLPSNGQGHS